MTGSDRSHGLPALSRVWKHVKLSDVSLGTRPRYSQVVVEDVKKPNKPNQISYSSLVRHAVQSIERRNLEVEVWGSKPARGTLG